jgi:hypothetical protein
MYARHIRDAFSGSKTNAYKFLGAKAVLGFLELVGVGFAGMLSRSASKGDRPLGQADDAPPSFLSPIPQSNGKISIFL